MTLVEMDTAVAYSIAGRARLMAPQKVSPSLAVVDLMTVGALFAKSAIALEQGLLVPVG